MHSAISGSLELLERSGEGKGGGELLPSWSLLSARKVH